MMTIRWALPLLLGASIHMAGTTRVQANQVVQIQYDRPTYIDISSYHTNYFSFKPNTITGVYGDKNCYDHHLDKTNSYLFVTSKMASGHSFPISIALANGSKVNMIMQAKDSKEGTIASIVLPQAKKHKRSLQDTTKSMLKAMKLDVDANFEVKQASSSFGLRGCSTLRFTQKKVYLGYDIMGIIFEIQNRSKRDIDIDEEALASLFSDVLLWNIESTELPAGAYTRAFLITSNQR